MSQQPQEQLPALFPQKCDKISQEIQTIVSTPQPTRPYVPRFNFPPPPDSANPMEPCVPRNG